MDSERVIRLIKKLREKDPRYADGRILSSVSTKPTAVSIQASRIFSDTNALDVNIFPSVKCMEEEIIRWFGKLLGNPRVDGYVASGGTEANIAALFIAKKLHPGRNEILAPESVHYSIERAADLLNLEIEKIPLTENFKADVNEIENRITEKTLAIIATVGTSALGVVDPVDKINELCEDIFLHVDAAFGGFVIPFLNNSRKIDFSLENVDSITIDPHKMGLAPIPAGVILFRNRSYLERIKTKPRYLPFSTATLLGSRPGASIAAVYANVLYYGLEGYGKIVRECMKNTKFLWRGIEKMSGADLVIKPELNFVAIKFSDTKAVWKSLIERGYVLSMDKDSESIRIVVMPHITVRVIQKFFQDLDEILTGIG
jgi:tyrosine decarboxylase/aspartate 1-decarboxylase